MVGEIDLELGGENTLYMDVVSMPSTVKVGLTVKAYNHDDVDLYFKVTGSDAAWTFNEKTLELIASGASLQRNLADLMERSKPTEELTETVTVTLNAYTDDGYTNLKHSLDVSLTVKWIKSDDGSWTEDFLNDFYDGTVQGWSYVNEVDCGYYPTVLEVATDYVLSPLYSLRLTFKSTYADKWNNSTCRIQKSFTTPNRNIVYGILNLRASRELVANVLLRRINVLKDGTVLVQVGVDAGGASEAMPRDKWMRIVVPLPKNTTVSVRVSLRTYIYHANHWARLWMDDFKIISKD